MGGLRYNWTAAMDAYIRENWGIKPPREIIKHLGVGKTALKGRLKKLGLPTAGGFYHAWTAAEKKQLARLYADRSSEEVAHLIGLTLQQVYRQAGRRGLEKSSAYRERIKAMTSAKLCASGAAHRFPKGHAPANKGKRGQPSVGRMAETQFKKGDHPGNWLPIGATRLSKEGYLQVKMTDTGYPPRDWIAMHNLVWELHHGPIPPKHHVAFRDGNRNHERIDPSNLELVSFADMMRRNTFHNYGKEVAQVVHLRAVITRKINKRMKANEQDHQRPA